MDPPPRKQPPQSFLITPSASPPPFLATDPAPPFKRQRTASVPRSRPSPSDSRTQTPIDVEKERAASRSRLFEVWSNLEERYARHIDDDDIVDIRTGEIVKDNGVLRSAPKLDFGDLASAGAEPSEFEDDEWYDELDSFAEPPHVGILGGDAESDLQAGGKLVPPVNSSNPLDAEDLRTFLQAEERRKEECGSDIDEEELWRPTKAEQGKGTDEEDVASDASGPSTTFGGRDCDDDPETEDDEPNTSDSYGIETPQIDAEEVSSQAIDSSEDELDNWDIDEGSFVKPVNKQNTRPIEQDDSDVEIVEPLLVSPQRDSLQKRTRTVSAGPSNRAHLLTPPNSSSSYAMANDKITSADESRHPPPRSSSSNDISRSPPYQNSTAAPRLDLRKLVNSSPRKQQNSSVRSNSASRSRPASNQVKRRPVVLLTPRKHLGTMQSVPSRDTGDDMQSSSHSKKKGKEREREPPSTQLPSADYSERRKPGKAFPISSSDSDVFTVGRSGTRVIGDGQWLSPEKKPSPVKKVHLGDQDSPISPTCSPRKRKRVASNGMAEHISRQQFDEGRGGSDRQSSVHRLFKKSPAHRTRRSSPDVGSDYSSDSSSDEFKTRHRNNRSDSRSRSMSCHEYPHMTPFAPHPHSQPGYNMLPDPRAHLIISQAVQQLSALFGVPWASHSPGNFHDDGIPHTPTHRQDKRLSQAAPYATPTHHHPYPYTYDPNLSHATLPPDSPESLHSSPDKSNRQDTPRKSLVRRSRSRGRRVSFKVEHDRQNWREWSSSPVPEYVDSNDKDESSPSHGPRGSRQKRSRSSSLMMEPQRKTKDQHSSDEETASESGHDVEHRPGRGQTPGPSGSGKTR